MSGIRGAVVVEGRLVAATAHAIDILTVPVAFTKFLMASGLWKTSPTCTCLGRKDLGEGDSESITVDWLLLDWQPRTKRHSAKLRR